VAGDRRASAWYSGRVTTSSEKPAEGPAESIEAAELSVSDALALAVQCHREGNLDAAERVYGAVLELLPAQPDALHFLGVLLHQRGDSARAVELIQRSIAEAPDSPGVFNNLGNVLYEAERFEEAASAYERALELAPNAGTYANLGATRRLQGRYEDAEAAYERALALDPGHADAHSNFANLLASRGRGREAIAHFCTAMTLRPDHPEARRQLGVAYSTLGRKDEAAAVYRQWLADEPDNAVAAHMLAACSGESVPGRASDRFVERVFDNFARSFDAKLAKLEYRAPELVLEALRRAVPEPAKNLVALDAGCGTGLCGALLEPYVSELTGVDLSAQMLVKARSRKLYRELVKAELTAYLATQQARFDLIVSADTLVYFGPLEAVLQGAQRALKPNGLLIFSVERATELAAENGHVLNANGRYGHAASYLRRALEEAGFAGATLEPGVLRKESALPVEGFIVSARRRG
jgi:predicted TPR repeat methyltransferase